MDDEKPQTKHVRFASSPIFYGKETADLKSHSFREFGEVVPMEKSILKRHGPDWRQVLRIVFIIVIFVALFISICWILGEILMYEMDSTKQEVSSNN